MASAGPDSDITLHNYDAVYASDFARVHLGDNHVNVVLQINPEELSSEAKQKALLSGLAYQDMNLRRNQLASKKIQDPDWIWDDKPSPGFVRWLNSNEPFFWVSGKPASGKSTLMKYVAFDSMCPQILQERSGAPWFILHFFFDFRAHTSIPNNLEGMCRSLLFQLAQLSPSIASSITQGPLSKYWDVRHNEAGLDSLQTAVEDCIRNTNSHVCIFVDGLDEYEGSFTELFECLKFKGLVDGAVAKICLASRPNRAIQLALKGVSTLRMQDHNHSTIAEYARMTFASVPAYLPDAHNLEALVGSLVAEAQGVILWAQLVCTDIVEGMLSEETFDELLIRIASYPQDLDGVYARLLSKTDERFKMETLLTLHLVRTYVYSTSDQGRTLRLPILRNILEILRDLGILPLYPKHSLTASTFEIRLHSRLGGLIDVIHYMDESAPSVAPYVRLFHKTLSTYLDKSGTILAGLPGFVLEKYPDHIWLRLYSEYLKKCPPVLQLGVDELVKLGAMWPLHNFSNWKQSNDFVEDVDLNLGQNIDAKTRSHLTSFACAINGVLERAESVQPESNLHHLIFEALVNPLVSLHISHRLFPARCACQWRNATVRGPEFLSRPVHERALLFSIAHGLWVYARQLRSAVKMSESLRAECSRSLLESWRTGRTASLSPQDLDAWLNEFAPALSGAIAPEGYIGTNTLPLVAAQIWGFFDGYSTMINEIYPLTSRL